MRVLPEKTLSEPVAAWSDAMFDVIDHAARCFRARTGREYDDFYQEGCLAVAAYFYGREGGSIELGRLRRLVRSRMRATYRKHARVDVRPKRRLGLDAPAAGMLAAPRVDLDARLDLRRAVASLPARDADTIRMIHDEGRTLAEVADARGVRYHAAVKHVMRANAACRSALGLDYLGRAARYRRDKRKRSNNSFDWSDWGPIPDQRDDD